MQGVRNRIEQLPSKQSVNARPPLPQSGALPGSALASQKPLQSGRSGPSEPDIKSASINRNTTSKNSPSGHNSHNGQALRARTEKLPTGGDLRIHNPEVKSEGGIRTLSSADGTRGTKRSALYAVSSLEPESGATKAAPLRADWPDTTGMSEGLLRVCIENARNLAFPDYIRGAQSFRIAS